ncbi:hypothetical protein KIPB_001575, partial [Kipferlia bialata]
YSLPQPDASVLTMKLAQHLMVVVTGDKLDRKYSGITSGVTPSPVQWLAAHVPSTTQFLDQRFGQCSTTSLPADVWKASVSMVVQLYDAATELNPERSYMFTQLMEFSIRATDHIWQRTLDERGKLQDVLKPYPSSIPLTPTTPRRSRPLLLGDHPSLVYSYSQRRFMTTPTFGYLTT